MAEKLSVAEIQARFVNEWVLVVEPEIDVSLAVRSGEVVFNGPDRDEVYRQAIALHPARFAFLYTGTLPENTAIVL